MNTSEKQLKANQANSKKSTGAKTLHGKATVAKNAIKHGFFSKKLILDGESIDEYYALLDNLISSSMPQGTLEHLLVEKIAIAMWRQLRLIKSETAEIELGLRVENVSVRGDVQAAMGVSWITGLMTIGELSPVSQVEAMVASWYQLRLDEIENLDPTQLKVNDFSELKKSPILYDYFRRELTKKGHANDDDYLLKLKGGLLQWVDSTADEFINFIKRIERKKKAIKILKIVQDKKAIPISNEALIRYQTSIDGELYKAIAALRKQQEWRTKGGVISETETV